MPGGFGNPIVGGTVLRIPAIQSPNYSAGSAGWTINIDGSAEFNNLTIRGTFAGTDFVMNSSGLFVYSGTPAANNLIASIAAAAGTDAYGNAYPSGICALNYAGATFVQLLNGALAAGGIVSGAADTTNAAGFAYVLGGGGKPFLHIASPLYPSGGYTDPALLLLQPGVPGAGLNGSSRPIAILIDDAATSAADLNLSGACIKTNESGATPYTWQTPTYATGFAGGGYSGTNYAPIQYRLDAEDNLVIVGTCHNTASVTNSPTVFTLPVGYRPANNWRGPVSRQVSGATNPENSGGTGCIVESNGNVVLQLDGASSSTMNYYMLLTVPMGNIS
jgi:hypothetical protein